MGFEESKQAIAQIYRTGRTSIAGTGFLVAERYVLTCAHVVRSALAGENQPVGATIEMQFPLQQPRDEAVYTAEVIFYEFEAEREGKDAALLYLTSPQLPSVPVTPLKFLGQCCNGSQIRAFGFLGGESAGRNLTAITEGSINGGWVQLKAPGETGVAVEDGASGSPVWCDAVDAFVGMVVAKDGQRVTARLGFLIPTEQLRTPLQALADHSQQHFSGNVETVEEPAPAAPAFPREEAKPRPSAMERIQQRQIQQLETRLSALEENWEAASKQLNFTDNAAARKNLERQIAAIEDDMAVVAQQLDDLRG